MIDTAKDSRLGRIFSNRTVRTYPAFAGFHAWRTLSALSDSSATPRRVSKSASRSSICSAGGRRQILGSPSGLKNRLLEIHPIYVLKAGDELSPVFESPLSLFDPRHLGPMIEEKYGIPRRRLPDS